MAFNPYAKFLAPGDNPDTVLAASSTALQSYLTQIGADRADTPIAAGKWSPRQIVAHLADCEVVFAFRIRQTLAEPGTTLQPFDQDLYARHYAAYSLDDALQTFLINRRWNLQLISILTAEERSRTATHPERGTMTLQFLLETTAGHDRNHLIQLQKVAESVA